MELKLRNIEKKYQSLRVLSDFSMTFEAGRLHCLFGPSGCGKTTLLNVVSGITPAEGGEILGLEGKTVSYVFQEDRLLPWETVEGNIRFVLESGLGKKEAARIAKDYLALVNLEAFGGSYPHQLSGGMKQRTALARGLAYDGEVFALDEPFKGLDFELKKGLMDYILEYGCKEDRLFLFVTHDIEEALYLADTVHVFEGPPLTLRKQVEIDIPPSDRKSRGDEMDRYRERIME